VVAIDLYQISLRFSPEDLYSNLLGIKIAGGLLMNQGEAETDVLYDRHMDEWLRATLAYLQPVSAGAGAEAMRLVDGVWWDSRARLPDPRLVLRRRTPGRSSRHGSSRAPMRRQRCKRGSTAIAAAASARWRFGAPTR
jgi:hypothetical protein